MEKKSEYTKMKGSKQLESGWMRRAAFWKMEVIIILMLTGFAFFINRHMKLECLYMDDLYQWYCYNDQSFWDAVFTMGGTRFRVLYNLVSWIEMALFGIHINWYVPFNIILNVGIAYTLYRMSRRFSHSIYVGVLCAVIFLSSRMSYYQIGQILGLMESMALWMALVILYLLYGYLNEEDGREEKRLYLAAVTYVAVCLVHERYMVLLPLFFFVLLFKKTKDWKLWAAPAGGISSCSASAFYQHRNHFTAGNRPVQMWWIPCPLLLCFILS